MSHIGWTVWIINVLFNQSCFACSISCSQYTTEEIDKFKLLKTWIDHLTRNKYSRSGSSREVILGLYFASTAYVPWLGACRYERALGWIGRNFDAICIRWSTYKELKFYFFIAKSDFWIAYKRARLINRFKNDSRHLSNLSPGSVNDTINVGQEILS